MADYATREEMLAAFGPFAVAFNRVGRDSTPYLSLLHLHDDTVVKVIELIREATLEQHSEAAIIALMQDVNWRPHLVGSIAAYFRRSDLSRIQMWRAMDAGSWVTPQIAAILSIICDDFVEYSIERLAAGCRLTNDQEYSVPNALERHVAQGPAGDHQRSAKMASSLLAMLRTVHASDVRVGLMENNVALQNLLAGDEDDSGALATSWRERFLELAANT